MLAVMDLFHKDSIPNTRMKKAHIDFVSSYLLVNKRPQHAASQEKPLQVGDELDSWLRTTMRRNKGTSGTLTLAWELAKYLNKVFKREAGDITVS